MKEAGFDIIEGDSAIVPVMLYDAKLSKYGRPVIGRRDLCNWLLFILWYQRGKARIRVQLSAATYQHIWMRQYKPLSK